MKAVTSNDAWTGIANCRTCTIRQSVLFAGLDESDFEHIHRPIEQFSYAPGTEIYANEDPAEWIITIRTGLVKLTQYLPDGTQRIVRLVRASDAIGLEALIQDRYEHHAIALHQTEVCRIPRSIVRNLLTRKPQLFSELMARWHRALSDSDTMIREFNTGPARHRVVRLLLWLAERNGGERCDLFGREDLGALLSLTTETVSRTMAELKRQGYISEPRTNQFLCDLPNLRRIVE
jgi:CRP-like cAMP-binding protein